MEYLFSSISEFLTPEMIFKTSKVLNEDQTEVYLAVQTTTASLLELIVKKGDKKKLIALLKGVGNTNILFNVSSLFLEEMSFHKQRTSARFLTYLLKDKLNAFYLHIASTSNISEKNTKKIVFKIALLVSAFLGEKLVSGISFSTLLEQLEDERDDFQMYIPFEMAEVIEKYSLKTFITQKLWMTFF